MNSEWRFYWQGWRLVVGFAFAELAMVAIGLIYLGTSADSLHWMIRWTARFSAVLFFMAFLASSLHWVFRRSWTATLLRERRYWGLAFAVSQLIHLFFIGLTYRNAPQTMGPVNATFSLGAAGYFFIALLALTSNDAALHYLGLRRWRILHSTGMYLLWAIITGTYVLGAKRNPVHLALAIIFTLALVFKLGVKTLKRRS